jgi:hypothetical protein
MSVCATARAIVIAAGKRERRLLEAQEEAGPGSGRIDRRRLERTGNRRFTNAIYAIALMPLCQDPQTATYFAQQREAGKTHPEAVRSLKRHLIRRDLLTSRRP